VLRGPAGGVVWPRSIGRRQPRGDRPAGDMEKQAIPATAPLLATQACLRVVEIVTLMGNSPRVLTGRPTMVSFVGSLGSIANIETVLEPGLTTNRVYEVNVSMRHELLNRDTYTAGYLHSTLTKESVRCSWSSSGSVDAVFSSSSGTCDGAIGQFAISGDFQCHNRVHCCVRHEVYDFGGRGSRNLSAT